MKDVLTFNNCLFVYDQVNENISSNSEDFFTISGNQQSYNTRSAKNNTIIKTSKHNKITWYLLLKQVKNWLKESHSKDFFNLPCSLKELS